VTIAQAIDALMIAPLLATGALLALLGIIFWLLSKLTRRE